MTSFWKTMPMTLSMFSEITGIREWPLFRVTSRTSSSVAEASTQTMSGRGTMTSRTTVSVNSKMEWIISRSSAWMTSSNWATSRIALDLLFREQRALRQPPAGEDHKKDPAELDEDRRQRAEGGTDHVHRPGRSQQHVVQALQHPGARGQLGELE